MLAIGPVLARRRALRAEVHIGHSGRLRNWKRASVMGRTWSHGRASAHVRLSARSGRERAWGVGAARRYRLT